jgi:hypothetical protein
MSYRSCKKEIYRLTWDIYYTGKRERGVARQREKKTRERERERERERANSCQISNAK